MNCIKIVTDRDITDTELNQIRDILLHSYCPNESLIESIKYCKGLVGGEIHIYSGDNETKSFFIAY